jgi:hypothetical protein
MKITSFLFLAFCINFSIANAQAPVLNPTGNVDGLRNMTPIQSISNFKTPVFKPNPKPYATKDPCEVSGSGTTKFKSIALNTRNGGVWLIDEKDSLTGCHFHYAQLQGKGSDVQYSSTVENLTSYFGLVFVKSKNGYGMMSGGHPSPTPVRKILEGIPSFPMPMTSYLYGDVESPDQLWYLNEKGYIRSASSTTIAGNIPPEKFAKMFTVYNRRFMMIDQNQDLYMWKPGFANWQKMGAIKAKYLTTDQGLGSVLWYIGIDDQVYYLHTEDPTPIAMNAKAKSIAVFGSQLYYIGLDGYLYLRVGQKDIRVAL